MKSSTVSSEPTTRKNKVSIALLLDTVYAHQSRIRKVMADNPSDKWEGEFKKVYSQLYRECEAIGIADHIEWSLPE